MTHRYVFTRMSSNRKLGGIPATMSSNDTCPDTCAFRGNGCYAEAGPLSWHWKKLNAGLAGITLEELTSNIRKLPRHQLYRLWQAGDFPGDGTRLDAKGMNALISANRGRKGFSYTHYSPLDPHNADLIRRANDEGLTINVSAETLEQADLYAEAGVGPVAVVLPIDATESLKTPAGRTVMVCPASIGDTTCALCALCQVPTRKAIIGFPAHGIGKAKAEAVFWAKPTQS